MKKVGIVLMFAALILTMCIMVAHGEEENYALVGVVIETDFETDTIYIQDLQGNIWAYEGCEDWFVGDIVGMIMNPAGTEIIYDDEIITLTYNGWWPIW